ncbi:helix-turn-helix domain-containing protein, partial [Corynebacterium belfantii]|nr:IS3 family transposase [Corynebacterium belfantii]
MRARSSLSQQQREQLVDLFKHGIDYSAASRQLSVSKYAVRKLLRRFKLHGRLCL